MKKIISLCLLAAMLLTVSACGEKKTEDSDMLDLTSLSSTMVYSEVYNMMNTPENYMGRTVKMKGNFSVYEDESTGNIYYACVIADATACCSQGIEFVLSEERSYPDEYPALGTEITVTGTFGTYQEGEYIYSQLSDAVME